jgi:microcystin-dependent protein
MATQPYIGEIRAFSFDYAPKNWAQCNGQTLQINQNQALFAILGTTYGGNGVTTFNLPNLQGRVPVGVGNSVTLGQVAGEAAVTLNINQIGHSHPVRAAATASVSTAAGNFPATAGSATYGNTLNASMNANIVSKVGGGQAHNNMQPYQAINYCICIVGIFPTRS